MSIRAKKREYNKNNEMLSDLIKEYFICKENNTIIIEDKLISFPVLAEKIKSLYQVWNHYVDNIVKNKSKLLVPERNALKDYIRKDLKRHKRDVWIRHGLKRLDEYYGLDEYTAHDLAKLYDPELPAEDMAINLVSEISPFTN